MRRFGSTSGSLRKLSLNAAGVFAAVAIVFGVVAVSVIVAQNAAPQTTSVPPDDPKFAAFVYEVASIKPGKSWEQGWGMSPTNDGLTGKNVPLMYLIQSAYGIYEKDRMIGAPAWASSEFYNIEAKMDTSTVAELQKLSKDQRKLAAEHMLQVLMADRFKLAAHHEARDLPVYLLVIARGGPKLQVAQPDSNGANSPHWGRGTTSTEGKTTLDAQQMTMDVFAGMLARPSGRTVLDKTGLTGKYEFKLEFTPNDSLAESNSPTLFNALREQLGLKLEPGKNSVDVVVIDHVERPSGN
jgi:uncharacterized protein (TIGR03435 family)